MEKALYDALLRLPQENIINLMWMALDEMQAYNGRSQTQCICLAIGAETRETGGRVFYKIPSHEKLIEATAQYPF